MYPNNPMLNQQIAQLEQEYMQKKSNLMQSFYTQQGSGWGGQGQSEQQTPSAPTQNVNWIYVSNINDAKNHIVQQGRTAWMMDNNEPYFYVKAVDNVGSTSFRIFHIDEVQEVQSEQAAQPQIDMSQYVQRDEFDALKLQLEQLTNTQKKQPQKANKGVEENG